MSSYCVKCGRKTANVNPRMTAAKNGRPMVQSSCGTCHSKKSEFVSGSAVRKPKGGKKVGKGIFDWLF